MRWRSFAVLSVTFFMLLPDFSIVNVALPAMNPVQFLRSDSLAKLDKAFEFFEPASFVRTQG